MDTWPSALASAPRNGWLLASIAGEGGPAQLVGAEGGWPAFPRDGHLAIRL